MWLLLLAACLIDTDRYEAAKATFTDDDGDGLSERDGDCDDGDAAVFDGAPEACDGKDNDCDTSVDEAEDLDVAWFADTDGDGFGAGAAVVQCEAPAGFVAVDGDCDDTDAARRPDAVETCDGVDEDCDGTVDDGVTVPTWYLDADGDGFGAEDSAFAACDAPGGHVAVGGDCDDADAAVNPDAPEEDCATAADDDCDGQANEQDARACRDLWYDADGDGYGADASACWCAPTGPWSAAGPGDCADTEPGVNPGATETCGNGLDDDCDGSPGTCGIAGAASLADADAVLVGATASGYAGASIAAAGDVDGDGYGDVLIGGMGGREASLMRGPMSGLSALSGADGTYRASTSQSGIAVSGGDDADGDGVPDVLVGVYGTPGGGTQAGAAYWVSGAPRGVSLLEDADWVGLSGEEGDNAGVAVDMGDYTGDGLADLVIGAPYADAGAENAGAVYLVAGPPTGGAELVDWSIEGQAAADQLGSAVAAGEDIDGDGIGDLVLGAPYVDDGGSEAGAAFVFLGPVRAGVSLGDADGRVLGGDAGDFAGASVAFAGDVDGDGAGDLLVGAFGDNSGGTDAGAVALFLTPPSGTVYLTVADARLTGASPGDFAGRSVAGIGDIDADGHDDFAASAHYRSASAGASYVVFGPVYGLASLSAVAAVRDGEASGDFAGIGLAGAGDVNGDGFPDLLVGAPGSDLGAAEGGAAYILLGGSW